MSKITDEIFCHVLEVQQKLCFPGVVCVFSSCFRESLTAQLEGLRRTRRRHKGHQETSAIRNTEDSMIAWMLTLVIPTDVLVNQVVIYMVKKEGRTFVNVG